MEHIVGQVSPRRPRHRVRGAKAAVLASAAEVKDGNAAPWLPDNEYVLEVLVDVINSRSAFSGPGNDGQRFTDLQSIIHTDIGRYEFGRGMRGFWRRIVDGPDAFPPELRHLFLPSILTVLGEKGLPVSVGMTWRTVITADAMPLW